MGLVNGPADRYCACEPIGEPAFSVSMVHAHQVDLEEEEYGALPCRAQGARWSGPIGHTDMARLIPSSASSRIGRPRLQSSEPREEERKRERGKGEERRIDRKEGSSAAMVSGRAGRGRAAALLDVAE